LWPAVGGHGGEALVRAAAHVGEIVDARIAADARSEQPPVPRAREPQLEADTAFDRALDPAQRRFDRDRAIGPVRS
jgi:hypothetical protein